MPVVPTKIGKTNQNQDQWPHLHVTLDEIEQAAAVDPAGGAGGLVHERAQLDLSRIVSIVEEKRSKRDEEETGRRRLAYAWVSRQPPEGRGGRFPLTRAL